MTIADAGPSGTGDGRPDDIPSPRVDGLFVDAQPGRADAVKIVGRLRPVPPRAPESRPTPLRLAGQTGVSDTIRTPVRPWPVYDPFSSRRRRAPEWLVNYTAGLVVGDLLAAVLGIALAVPIAAAPLTTAREAVALTVLWPALQAMLGSYAERRLGTGADEFRRVAVAGLVALAALAAAQQAATDDLRRLILVAVPITLLFTLAARLLKRRGLHAARRRGRKTKRVVVVGREVAVVDVISHLRRDSAFGMQVVGACVPHPMESTALVGDGIPALGGLEDVLRILDEARADAVLVTSASETAGQYLRDLAWRLEGTNIELLVAPGVLEVAPNRLQVRPTTSMPLIQIREPEFRGYRRLTKSVVDRSTAAVLLLILSPLFAVIAAAVRVSSPGPAFYRHSRIGKRGEEFDVLKFRTMRPGSDSLVETLMAHNEGNAVQFKMRQDPRVTRVGAFLRRYSLDELPQLLNVLKGDMSLVGPRPHVTREVAQYGPDMHRRLLVKPGITGLWQVSGRSDLSWDESVELDVRYVENWSLSLDLSILWRTVRAVMTSSGAY